MSKTPTNGAPPTAKKKTSLVHKIPNDIYEAELFRLQTEFVKLQEWVRDSGARIPACELYNYVEDHVAALLGDRA